MIARIWRGVVRTAFITFSLWDTVDAIREFAGEDHEARELRA